MSLDDLYRRHGPEVTRLLRRWTRSVELADDLAAEVFLHAARQYRQGRGAEVSISWLVTVARRRCVDHWRQLARRSAEAHLATTPEEPSLSERVELTELLATLSTRERRAVVLRYVDGWPVAAVADDLGISYRAAESVLARARRRLRREIPAA